MNPEYYERDTEMKYYMMRKAEKEKTLKYIRENKLEA